jgi:phosphatidylserine/phosphatidylglycerophosphate/cardiolipin synthase-like enzyme
VARRNNGDNGGTTNVRRRGGIRRHHVIGAGVVASAMGVYHFASQNGLVPQVFNRPAAAITSSETGFPGTSTSVNTAIQSNPNSGYQSNTASNGSPPAGVPVSYNANYNAGQTPVSNTYAPNGFNNQTSNVSRGDIQVLFSPKGGCTDAIVNELNQARLMILVQAYSFTSEPIAAACVAAHRRGVPVYVVLDKSQETEQYSAADFLANNGIPTLIDSQHAIAHNKVILIDGQTLITGSFNFTKNAEQSNAENLLIIRNQPDLYAAYENNIRHHYEHSKQHIGRGTTQDPSQGTNRQRTR